MDINKIYKNRNRGFTLLEILLVIAAIGILAAIVLIAINPNRQISQARDIVRQSDINTIHKALEQYLIDNGRYPTSVSTTPKYICDTGIERSGSNVTNCSNRVDLRELVPVYLSEIPKDPQAIATSTGYNVAINIENGKLGISADLAENKLISINSLNIVQDGLVLYLDAGNTLSYPSTGITWLDLSENINNRVIMNNVNFDSSIGSFNFNGSNQCIIPVKSSELSTSLSDNVSVSMWISFSTGYGNNAWNSIFAKRGYGGVVNYGINYNPVSNIFQWYFGGTRGTVSLQVPLNSNFQENKWTHVSGVFLKSGNDTDSYLYKNGSLLNSGLLLGNMTEKNVDLRIGCYGNNTFGNTEHARISIAQISVYNKALTPTEVQKNFNSLRGRFGL